jgi:RNA polymerase sigma-70 factor (ECF subfamily)
MRAAVTAGSDQDEQLLAAIDQGDHQAYATLVNRHADKLFGYLLRLTSSRADAEDLLQETFIRAWRKAATYQPGRVKVSTWLHRIAHNLFIDAFRSQRRLNDISEATTVSRDLVDIQIASEQLALIEAAISRLPDNQRAALLLCHTQGFSNAEAGEILGLQVRAVESLIARARRSLRSVLTDTRPNFERTNP